MWLAASFPNVDLKPVYDFCCVLQKSVAYLRVF